MIRASQNSHGSSVRRCRLRMSECASTSIKSHSCDVATFKFKVKLRKQNQLPIESCSCRCGSSLFLRRHQRQSAQGPHSAWGVTIADGLWEWLESVGIYVRLSSFLLMWLRETRASGLWHPSAKGEVVQVRTECCYSERDGWNEMEREAGSYL